MERLASIIDDVYPAICKDNDERPSAKALELLKERTKTDSKFFSEDGNFVLRQGRLGLHGSLALAKSVQAGQIRRLDLSDNHIDDYSVVALLQVVDNNPGMTELHLGGNKIGADGASEIAKTLPQLRSLTLLSLGNDPGIRQRNAIGNEGARLLADAVAKNFYLTTLNLAGNALTDKDAVGLAQMLRLNLTLTLLDLDRNKLGTRGGQLMFEALARNKALRHLYLSHNGIGTDAARSLGGMLAVNSSLITLHLADNNIGPALPEMGDALLNNTSLIVFDMRGNGVACAGAQVLAQVMSHNVHLTCMNLGKNNIGEKGGMAIARSLAKNCILTTLDLSFNDIRDASAICFAEAIVNNTTLVDLDLSSCKVADDGAVAIATAVGSNDGIALRALRLRDNYISSSAGQIMLDELQGNYSITTADFRGNRMDHTKLAKIRSFCKRNQYQIRNQVPKRLKEHVAELTKEIEVLAQKRYKLQQEKELLARTQAELEAINEEKLHCHLGQQAQRDELEKQVATEEQQLMEIQNKIKAKEAEVAVNCANFAKTLSTKESQLDVERKQRMKMEEQVAIAEARLKELEVKFTEKPEQIEMDIDLARKEKLKYQAQMTQIRARCNALQKGYDGGEGIPEYLELARYALLHPAEADQQRQGSIPGKSDPISQQLH